MQTVTLALLTTLGGISVVSSAAPPPGAGENLGFDLGDLALRFSRLIQPPFRGLETRDAKQYLRLHIPPIEPIGGWDRQDQQATRNDLIVIICKRLRLPIPMGHENDAAAYWQALGDFASTQNEETVHAIIGLFKELTNYIDPTNPLLVESEQRFGWDPGPQPSRRRTPI